MRAVSRALFALVWLLLAAVAAAGDFRDGVAAYKSGDFDTARATFERLAAAGDPRAQFALGILYDNGEGVAADDRMAVSWYRRAARAGLAKAQYNLALMLERGEGVAADPGRARYWLLRAALGGNGEAVRRVREQAGAGRAWAQGALGAMYLRGEGLTQDFAAARRWLEQAASAAGATPRTHHNLAVMLERGLGGAADAAAARAHYETAAQAGERSAAWNLGRLLLEAGDAAQARRWLEQAARQGHVRAAFALGLMADEGQGMPADRRLARRWYRQAAERGDPAAQNNLACAYADPPQGDPDRPQAWAWFSLAERLGLPQAGRNREAVATAMSADELAAGRALLAELGRVVAGDRVAAR